MIEFNYIQFPDPRNATSEGIVAMGGDLSTDMLISAYMQGIFPWFNQGDPILWWSPEPRMILYPKNFKVSKSLKQELKKRKYVVTVDTQFREVMTNCSTAQRPGQKGTWITSDMIEAYCNLHDMGVAHSVEVYENNKLIGGLYGLALGKAFFGESMFHTKSNASKIALFNLCKYLIEHEFHFIDVQQSTSHLQSLGAVNISREQFFSKLKNAIAIRSDFCKWHL